MHDQHVTGREVGEEIFRPTAEAGHGLAFEPTGKILRQRPAQIAAVNFHFGEPRPFHRRLKAAPHCLDFREFWHVAGLGVAENMVKLRHIASLPAPRYGCVKGPVWPWQIAPISARGKCRSHISRRWSTTYSTAWRTAMTR